MAWPWNTPSDGALVEQHAMTERVEVDVEDRATSTLLGDAGRVRAHFAQPAVFLLERRESLQLQVRADAAEP